MGAWIETEKESKDLLNAASHPTWVRGLKQYDEYHVPQLLRVAPYVGAWIETKPRGGNG